MSNTGVLVLDRSSTQYATRSSAPTWLPDGDHTAFWRMKLASSPSAGQTYTVVQGTVSGVGTNDPILIYVDENNHIYASLRNLAGQQALIHWGNYEVPVDCWVTCAITCDISEANATKRELFVDGASYGNGSVDVDNAVTSLAQACGTLTCGYNLKSSNGAFDGKIDELLFFNAILTPAEILALQLEETDSGHSDLYSGHYFNGDLTDSVGTRDFTGVNSPTYDTDDLPDFYCNYPRAIEVTAQAGGIGFHA